MTERETGERERKKFDVLGLLRCRDMVVISSFCFI